MEPYRMVDVGQHRSRGREARNEPQKWMNARKTNGGSVLLYPRSCHPLQIE